MNLCPAAGTFLEPHRRNPGRGQCLSSGLFDFFISFVV